MFSGYVDFEATVTNPGQDGSDFFFDNHHFNFVALGDLYGDVFAGAEVQYEHAGQEVALEYSYLGFDGINNLRIVAGKFIVPFGRFNKDLHPSWINKMADQPNGFSNVFPNTYSDVGIWVSGALPLGVANRFVYDAFVVNGLMGPGGSDIRDMRGNDRERQAVIEDHDEDEPEGDEGDHHEAAAGRDDNKAVGARLGIEIPSQGLDFGGSVYYGNYSDTLGVDLMLLMIGGDAAFRSSGFELRGEVVHASQEVTSGADLSKTGGYVQAAYRATSIFEPVVRFSARNMPGEGMDQTRFSLGLNCHVSAAAIVRLDYHVNTEKSGFETDNNALILQFATSF